VDVTATFSVRHQTSLTDGKNTSTVCSTMTWVVRADKKIKNGKAPGPENTLTGVMKEDFGQTGLVRIRE